MTDDTTGIINNASCYQISNESSIYAYRNNVRYSYVRIGSKWQNTGQQQYNSVPNGVVCYNFSDIASLNSYHVFEPIYIVFALLCVIFVWILWFSIFRRITKWKP